MPNNGCGIDDLKQLITAHLNDSINQTGQSVARITNKLPIKN